MRACMVAYTYYENDNRVMRYAEALVARGDVVDVIALRKPGQPRAAEYRGVHLLRIQKRTMNERKGKLAYLARMSRFLLRSFACLAWRHLRYGYRVVHVHSPPDFEVFAALVPKILGARILLDIHDVVPEFYCSKFGVAAHSPVFRALAAVERASIAFSHHTIVANDIWRARLLSRSAAAGKCTTVLNYPDPGIFYRRPRIRRDDRFIVMYPGTINYHQGIDIAVRAFALLGEKAPKAELHIYGEGPDRDAVAELIESLGLAQRVFLFPMVPIVQVADIMSEADLGIIPKRRDSFGDEAFSTKSLEFMALGVPLLIANTTIDTYYFNATQVAFFESENISALACEITRLYGCGEERRRLVEQGLSFISANNWSVKKNAYFQLLESS
jgi:glycosyltransferase involved in cell wall biosynthesis